jgi:superfamily II DNA or RNA helicase
MINALCNNPKVHFIAQQHKAAEYIVDRLLHHGEHCLTLSAIAGHGKTFVLGAVIAELWQWLKLQENADLTFAPTVLWLTKNSLVYQTEKVLYEKFSLSQSDVRVTNYEHLRSADGIMRWIKVTTEETLLPSGTVVENKFYSWQPFSHPVLLIADECHTLVNPDAIVTKIVAAFRKIKNSYYIETTATRATTVNELMLAFLGRNI